MSAVGTPMLAPNSDSSPRSWLRNGIGELQPRISVPTALTNPSCGESSTCQTNVIATTGATHGSSRTPRTSPRPRNERRTSSAAHRPRTIAPVVPNTEYSSVFFAASRNPDEPADLQKPDPLERQDQRPQHGQHHHHQHDDDGGRHQRHAGARVAPRAGVPGAALGR